MSNSPKPRQCIPLRDRFSVMALLSPHKPGSKIIAREVSDMVGREDESEVTILLRKGIRVVLHKSIAVVQF
jgi:hypothetical protein